MIFSVCDRVENIVGKYKQFLLFPQCLQKASFPEASKGVIVWEWVNSLPNDKYLDWSILKVSPEDKINAREIPSGMGKEHCRKRRKCCLAAFSHFPTMF